MSTKNNQSFGLKISLLTASMMTMMANAVIAPALPSIAHAFSDLPNAEFLTKMMMTLPALSIALSATFAGILVDKYGRIKVLIISLLIYALAGTTGLWLDDLYFILAGRFLLGFGVAGIMTAATTLIGDYFNNEERNAFMGLQGAFMGIGGMTFISLAGVLSGYNWRYPFYIYGFSILVLVLVLKYLHEPKMKKQTQEEMDTSTPLLPIFKRIWMILFSGFFGMSIFYIIPVQLPFYLKTFEGVSDTEAGLAIAAMTLTQTLMAIFYRKAKSLFNYQGIYAICFALMGLGLFLLGMSSNYTHSILSVMVLGLGAGWLMPNASLWMMATVDESVRGRFIGILSLFTFSGMLLSPVFIQPIQNWVGMKSAFTVVATVLVVAVIAYIFASLKEKKSLNNKARV